MDRNKTKRQLIEELTEMRRHVVRLEKLANPRKTGRKAVKDGLPCVSVAVDGPKPTLLCFERLLSELFTKLINLPISKMDAEILRGLEAVVKFLGVDRATILQIAPIPGRYVVWPRQLIRQLIDRVEVIGDIFASTLARKQAERPLAQSP
ncbi:MAG: hypothetical protein A4E57_01259 [Syntrophorhabdaceae bacterium PtaU1.Bin034]|nr:MAG: hypothetical protein A4E57_01259 [Syntrophorhabdaceae bacterium PtaU1.Bin034]